MTTRERILIVGMAGALVWGGVSLSLSLLSGRLRGPAKERQQDDTRLFAKNQEALIVPLRLSPWERGVLDKAQEPWTVNPFEAHESSAQPVAAAAAQEFTYTGYLQIGNQQLAIINGREYRRRDKVAGTDFQVESIQPDHVVLLPGSGGRQTTIAMKTAKHTRELP